MFTWSNREGHNLPSAALSLLFNTFHNEYWLFPAEKHSFVQYTFTEHVPSISRPALMPAVCSLMFQLLTWPVLRYRGWNDIRLSSSSQGNRPAATLMLLILLHDNARGPGSTQAGLHLVQLEGTQRAMYSETWTKFWRIETLNQMAGKDSGRRDVVCLHKEVNSAVIAMVCVWS